MCRILQIYFSSSTFENNNYISAYYMIEMSNFKQKILKEKHYKINYVTKYFSMVVR